MFREHILTCFIADPIGIALRDEIGIDNICWEQDYPHSDSSWPTAPEELVAVARQSTACADAEIDKITHENAMRWYRFDPFATRPTEQCTVGALRAEVAGPRRVDPLDGRRPPGEVQGQPRRAGRSSHCLSGVSGASWRRSPRPPMSRWSTRGPRSR